MSVVNLSASERASSSLPELVLLETAALELIATSVALAAIKSPLTSSRGAEGFGRDIKIIYRKSLVTPLASSSKPLSQLSFAEISAARARPQNVVIYDGISLTKTTADKVGDFIRSLSSGTIEYVYENLLTEAQQATLSLALDTNDPTLAGPVIRSLHN